MPGYLVACIRWHDVEAAGRYKRLVDESLVPFGGRYLARGAPFAKLEGAGPDRLAVIEFPTAQDAADWSTSTEYAPARAIRLEHATTEWIVVMDHI